jgi:orotate phosphoribosyltransferase
MLTDAEVLKEFEDAEAILRGHFILSSGLHSDTYMQCARVLMNPKRAEKLCAALADKIRSTIHDPRSIDLVVAPAMGGVVVGYEMGRQLGVETIFCERENGVFALRRGFRIEPDARVLLVEDVVTTGKSSLETVTCIEAHGGKVIAEASLVDRSGGESKKLPFPLISLLTIEVQTFPADQIPAALQSVEAIKPGSRFLKK